MLFRDFLQVSTSILHKSLYGLAKFKTSICSPLSIYPPEAKSYAAVNESLLDNLIDFGCSTLEDVYDSEMFKEFQNEIVKNTDYAGIEIIGVDPNYLNTGEFYIDHQSYYSNYKKFLEDYNLTLFEYLFNSQYFVIIDNDNR